MIGNHAEVRFLLFGKYHTLSGRQVFFSTCGERDGERSKGRSRKGGARKGTGGRGGDTGTPEFGLAWASVAMGTESTLTDRRFTPGSDGCPRGKRGGASGSVACLADFLLSLRSTQCSLGPRPVEGADREATFHARWLEAARPDLGRHVLIFTPLSCMQIVTCTFAWLVCRGLED